MEKWEVKNESELIDVAQSVLKKLAQHSLAHASVLALRGDLGAGKTTFVKELAHLLGVEDEVTSPTFVIMKFYACGEMPEKDTPFQTLVHIDAYRIDAAEEMRVLHFDEVLKQKDTLVCIEWADRISDMLPSHTLWMDITSASDGVRTITLS